MQYKLEKPVSSTIGITKYQCKVEWRSGEFLTDEPVNIGGQDTGPDPYTLLLASLASCKIVTLRMYIDRKGWNVPVITAKANMFQTNVGDNMNFVIDCDIIFPDARMDGDQKKRLLQIAEQCPVSKILQGDIKVRTYIFHEEDVAAQKEYSNDQLAVVWKAELCKHSGRCVTQLPEVFNLKAHPWINAKGADNEKIIDQVSKCPTGALSIKYK